MTRRNLAICLLTLLGILLTSTVTMGTRYRFSAREADEFFLGGTYSTSFVSFAEGEWDWLYDSFEVYGDAGAFYYGDLEVDRISMADHWKFAGISFTLDVPAGYWSDSDEVAWSGSNDDESYFAHAYDDIMAEGMTITSVKQTLSAIFRFRWSSSYVYAVSDCHKKVTF